MLLARKKNQLEDRGDSDGTKEKRMGQGETMNMPGEERRETREPVQLYMQFNKALLIVYYLSGTV